MAHLHEKVPAEFSDDERWYRIFTKKSLATMIVGCAIAAGVIAVFTSFGLLPLGIVLGGALGVSFFCVTVLKLPGKDVLSGSGCTMDVIALRIFTRKRQGRIYMNLHDESGDY